MVEITVTCKARGTSQPMVMKRARLLALPDFAGCRHQIEEYNRQLAIFNKRFARFQDPTIVATSLTDGLKHNVVTGYGGHNK